MMKRIAAGRDADKATAGSSGPVAPEGRG